MKKITLSKEAAHALLDQLEHRLAVALAGMDRTLTCHDDIHRGLDLMKIRDTLLDLHSKVKGVKCDWTDEDEEELMQQKYRGPE